MNFNRLFALTFLTCALFFTASLCKRATKGFSILLISSNRSYDPAYATRPLTPDEKSEVNEALNQTYSYFNRGAQAFAFVSQDGKYVLKLFDQHLYRPSKLLNAFPWPFLGKYTQKRNFHRIDKQKRDFTSYKLAFEQLQEVTGVIFVHLHRTEDLQKKLTITDRLGIAHTLNLDDFDFIVQKRADLVYDRINHLMKTGKTEESKQAIQEVFRLIRLRASKGFYDRDPDVGTNCGFVDGRAIKIDVGRLVPMESMQTEESQAMELMRIGAPFKKWIASHHPLLLDQFDEVMNESR